MFAVPVGRFRIGRLGEMAVSPGDSTVSRHDAEFDRSPERVVLPIWALRMPLISMGGHVTARRLFLTVTKCSAPIRTMPLRQGMVDQPVRPRSRSVSIMGRFKRVAVRQYVAGRDQYSTAWRPQQTDNRRVRAHVLTRTS